MLTKTNYIVEMFGYIAADTATRYGSDVTYSYGHLLEVIDTLRDMQKNATQAAKRFPLIVLIQDFEEDRGKSTQNLSDVSLTILIANLTSPHYKSADRYTHNFQPTLYPVYNYFMEAIARSGYFTIGSKQLIEHTKIDRPYYGKKGDYGNVTNLFDNYIDAIEINNLTLSVLTQSNCLPLNNMT